MQSPYSNPYLSLTARGLFAYYAELGRVASSEEISAAVPEGRDAVRNAMRELKQSNYIKAVKVQINGHWRTELRFTDYAKKWLATDDGFSGALITVSDITTSTSDIATSTNRLHTNTKTKEMLRISKEREESEMAWPIDDEKPQPKKRNQVDESDTGAIGKLIDRQTLLNKKYKAKVSEDSLSHRTNKPEEDWTTEDLVLEFYDLADQHAAGFVNQVNKAELSKMINKFNREGVERIEMLKAIRMFFSDKRNLHDLGVGKPLWIRFIAYFPTVQGLVKKPAVTEYVSDDFKATQEKMIKLLGGK
jgi:hypothetical protein